MKTRYVSFGQKPLNFESLGGTSTGLASAFRFRWLRLVLNSKGRPMTHPKKSASRQLLLTVDGFIETLEHPHKTAIQELREFILSIDGRIKEQVKWNAPSFYLEDNFATLRVHPAPIVQLVLHNGSKKKPIQSNLKFLTRMESCDGLRKTAAL